jgi:hypothetical protein
LAGHHIGNLDDWVYLSLWKDAFPSCTFDIEAQDAQRCDFGPIAFWGMRNELVISTSRVIALRREKDSSDIPNDELDLTV